MSLHQQMIDESRPDNESGIVKVLRSLSQADRDAVLEAMADPKVKSTAIKVVLNNNGHDVSYDMVRRFRARKVHIPNDLDFGGEA